MIIDAHVHLGLDPQNDVPRLIAAMDDAGIAKSAVFAATIKDVTTEQVLDAIAGHPDRLFAVGAVSPLLPKFRPAPWIVGDQLASGRIRALKFYTGYEHFYPADERLRTYLQLLVSTDRPAIFHCGDLFDQIPGGKLKYAHPLAVDDLAAEMPDLKIVIAHVGSPWATDAAQVCYKNKNVYTDCSGFVYGDFSPRQKRRFRKLWETFDDINEGEGWKKMLFGSDWPISHMRGYVELVRELCGSEEAAEAVFSDNAIKVFGL